MEENKDSYVLRLTGKAELPQAIEIGHNFRVEAEGSITAESKHDNNDGSMTYYWTFKPVHITAITDKGESLKLKDSRSSSQLLRGALYKHWLNRQSPLTFDDWYQKLMLNMIQATDEIAEIYAPEK